MLKWKLPHLAVWIGMTSSKMMTPALEWCLHDPDYTCPTLFTPSPYVTLLPRVSSHEFLNLPLDSDDSLREQGFKVCMGVLQGSPVS